MAIAHTENDSGMSGCCFVVLFCFLAFEQFLIVTLHALTSWKQIEDYIDQQFEQYFRDESGLNRRNIQDNRVHCCLYFISPFSHGCAATTHPTLSSGGGGIKKQLLTCMCVVASGPWMCSV